MFGPLLQRWLFGYHLLHCCYGVCLCACDGVCVCVPVPVCVHSLCVCKYAHTHTQDGKWYILAAILTIISNVGFGSLSPSLPPPSTSADSCMHLSRVCVCVCLYVVAYVCVCVANSSAWRERAPACHVSYEEEDTCHMRRRMHVRARACVRECVSVCTCDAWGLYWTIIGLR